MKSKFKFVFHNGEILHKQADSINDAAILAAATRINGGKSAQIMTSFAEDPANKGQYKPVSIPCVTINLKG